MRLRAESTLLGALLGSAGIVELLESAVKLSEAEVPIPYEAIQKVSWTEGFIWGDLILRHKDGESWRITLPKPAGAEIAGALAERVEKAVELALITGAQLHKMELETLWALLDGPRYVRKSELESSIAKLPEDLKYAARHPMAAGARKRLPEGTRDVVGALIQPEETRQERNRSFVTKELAAHAQFFDEIGGRPLTEEQRTAAIVLEDRTLVSAAAGSGKTATLVAKAGYLIMSGAAAADEILLLAFNNSAAKEIGERLAVALDPMLRGRTIEARTFHAFGLDVIAQATGRKPSIYDAASQGGELPALAAMIERLSGKNSAFSVRWLIFRSTFLKEPRNPADFRSIEEWDEFVESQGRWDREGKGGFLTMNNELVKSQGELAIANWLAMHCVPYEYEKPYKFETANKEFVQYRPDFYLPKIDAYLEHYALDKNGKPPKAFGARYAESMAWKRALHKEKGTTVIETTFAQLVDGTLFDRLEMELTARGQRLARADKNEILEKLKAAQEYDYPAFLQGVVRPFISHAKCNRIASEALRRGEIGDGGKARERMFCSLMADIIDEYNRQLSEAREVDFDDMIVMAEEEVLAGRYKSRFKAILVDEFQDISVARARLVGALLKQSPEATLLAVGDARQSIYRFAGSDIAVFRQFEDVFGHTQRLRLSKTFRFNRGIAQVSSEFVGPYDGDVISDDPTEDYVVHVCLYKDASEVTSIVHATLKDIADEVSSQGRTHASVLVLYRINKTGDRLGSLPDFSGRLLVRKMSVHKSKGLEADFVIIVGITGAGPAQFPSKAADDRLLQLVMAEKETDNAEERRLMYVAMTRARRRTYMVASATTPSVFITELIERAKRHRAIVVRSAKGEPAQSCPACGRGILVLRRGPFGTFYGCSRYPKCKNKQSALVDKKKDRPRG